MGWQSGMIRLVAERTGIKDVHLYLPWDLFEWVQVLAKSQRRTVNSQIVVLLEQARDGLPPQPG